MAKLCPGQDTRFWRSDDIFEVACGACGSDIEFFKDDVYRRCSSCGRRVENPKFNLGCANWCDHAKECLGYDPKETEIEDGDGTSLLDKLVEILRRELEDDPERFARAVRAQEYAKEILKVEQADPKVVILASLLHEVGVADNAHWKGEESEPPLVRRLLEEASVHWSVVDRVCRLVGCEHSADGLDTPE
ncbi:MAG: HD domain-containing protein, partial [Planctomycetota bacterium]